MTTLKNRRRCAKMSTSMVAKADTRREAALDCAAIQLQQARNSVVELLSAANEVVGFGFELN